MIGLAEIDCPGLISNEVAHSPAGKRGKISGEYDFGCFVFIPVVDGDQIEFSCTAEKRCGNLRRQRTTGDTHLQGIVDSSQQLGRRCKSKQGETTAPTRLAVT